MADFMVRFLICNVFISGIIGILLASKRIFRHYLSGRMQYNLWFLLLGLLAVPFLPFRLIGMAQIFSWLDSLRHFSTSAVVTAAGGPRALNPIGSGNWINDFTLSVNSKAPSVVGYILSGIWIGGMFAIIVLTTKSSLRLNALQKSALPLQNPKVRRLYRHCLQEMRITRDIPVYSSAFLKSPIIVGILEPRIYLPIHLISDYKETAMRYMLLHELQHYRYKDNAANYLMNLARVLYWFNPLVWYALEEMRSDREIACDTSVLKMLERDSYEDYGNTLINFVRKVSLTSFPFTASLGGDMRQMKKRIVNIATYEVPTLKDRIKGITAFILTAALLLTLAPVLSTQATELRHYQWKSSSEAISYVDFSDYFGEYEGSFVLYDLENDTWSIHNIEHATLRVSPDSTYKIYDALLGLEKGVITPKDSLIAWNGEIYPFETWNADQTLQSAMLFSVNWYFQALDEQLGTVSVYNYLREIGYGNQDMRGDFSTYWMESSLKISPVEQVELLTKLHDNSLSSAANAQAVKDSICLSSTEAGSLYGKTGTGRVDGQDVNGWFIGYIETAGNTYFFATNIRADANAAGTNAAEITMYILSDLQIWK
ncbi:MAG: BlaR1 family beta-lactam sensor/signal transducer [Lachnospiraceae bacterium]|nr:BlaR1 family beta-lactam sensor/signal transducer [Lachnospiraceae bacterium]